MRVSFQGETGAFSEQALKHYFDGAEAVPCPTFDEAFNKVAQGTVDRAIIPIENSLFGSVHANYDLLRQHSLQIIGEMKLRIVHNLMTKRPLALTDVTRVLSHPQALGQCQQFLKSDLGHAEIVAAYDTAGAAKMVAEGEQDSWAAIASLAAAHEYGLEILAAGIESDHTNYTRFLVLAKDHVEQDPTAAVPTKTSLVYALRDNIPGALFKALAVFALRDIDLLKIESRPLIGSPFAYMFYLDISGSIDDDAVQKGLGHLSEIAGELQVLGSYPVGQTFQ